MPRGGSLQLGIVIALATLAGVGISYLFSGGEMFSPGELHDPPHPPTAATHGVHSHAEIAANCAACHAGPWSGQTQAALCLDCHTDVRQQISERKSFHGRLTDVQSCRNCHSEHNGRTARLIDLASFDHHLTAFPLTGRHQSIACESCHKNQVFQTMAHACADCHEEPASHRGKFGVACAACHSTTAWTGAKFAHKFPINHGGAMRKTETGCATCHQQADDFRAYTCYGCHEHEPSRIERKHRRLNAAALARCADCHSLGHGDRRGDDL